MRKHLATLLAAVASMIFAGAEARAADIYVLTGSATGGNTPTNFGKIDSVTGVYANIASSVAGSNVARNLVWNSDISAFYTTVIEAPNTQLRTLDTSGTLSSQIGSTFTKIVYGMAYRQSNNLLYGYDFVGDATGTISPTAGGWSLLKSSAGASSSVPSGGRYAMHNETIYMTINSAGKFGTMGFTSTSTFSQVGSNNTLFANMVLASDGTTLYGLYGNGVSGNQKLYSIDPTNGATTFVTNVSGAGLSTYFYGAAIVPVPEPSTYALGAIASGVMAYLARRRKARRA